MRNWLKNKLQKMFSDSQPKRGSEFNFEKYILELGFKFISEKNDYKLYVNNFDGIKLNLIINMKKEEVLIYHRGSISTRINFIPNGYLFTDMLIGQILKSVEKKYVLEQ